MLIFLELQDEIVDKVVDALVGNGSVIIEDIGKRIKTATTDKLSVYECRNFVFLAVFSKLMQDKITRNL